MDDRTLEILAQVAFKAAVETYGEKAADDVDGVEGLTLAYARALVSVIDALKEEDGAFVSEPSFPARATDDEVKLVTDAFPGSVEISKIPPKQPISADSPVEVLWADALVHNRDDWYDNYGDPRASSGGGKGPDFKHKSLKKGRFTLGLWVNSNSTPDWVHQLVEKRHHGGR
ncbi:MAG: hypothetical protein D6746_07490 [Bacteroidetes bacterium]|nr:MAG: hypothetical protein D6746_07490 [Bacteroidota bacterium]